MHRTILVALALAAAAAAPVTAQETMSKDNAMAGKGMASDKMMMGPTGTFAGSKDHSASGSFTISGSGKDRKLELSDNFKVDEAPDIYVILSGATMTKDAGSLDLGKLKKMTGTQSFKIPESARLTGYTDVLLWSKKDGVVIGEAPLGSASMDHGAMGSMNHGSMEKGAMMDKPAMAKDTGMMKSMAKDSMMKKP
jgi:hypothetical protein